MIHDFTRLAVLWRRLRRRRDQPPPVPRVIVGFDDHGQPVEWPRTSPERAGHVIVLGSSGAGKTVLVASALLAEALADD